MKRPHLWLDPQGLPCMEGIALLNMLRRFDSQELTLFEAAIGCERARRRRKTTIEECYHKMPTWASMAEYTVIVNGSGGVTAFTVQHEEKDYRFSFDHAGMLLCNGVLVDNVDWISEPMRHELLAFMDYYWEN